MALVGTGLAAVGWSGAIRLYFQDVDGWVRESAYNTVWAEGSSINRKFKAPLKTPLAATTANNGANVSLAKSQLWILSF